MNDEVTIGELARLLADFKMTVDRIETKLDGLNEHYVPRETYELERDSSRADRASMRKKLDVVLDEISELRRDTFSKKAIYGLFATLSAIAVGAGTIAAVFRH